MNTEKILGKTYRVGTKGHSKAVAQKKHFDEMALSESHWEDLKEEEMQWEARQEIEDSHMTLEEQFEFIFGQYILGK